MNTTNSPAGAALQTIAAHAGYNLSGPELTALAAAVGGAVHVLHVYLPAVGRFWARIGGWQGIRTFLKTGKTTP
jgi:hypothetical protein